MRSQVLTTSGVSVSSIANTDQHISPFNIGIGIVVTGTVTYTLQHTFDDIMNTAAGNIVWFPHDDAAFVNATAGGDTNFGFPCTGIQINQTAGTGSVKATVIQAGLPRG